MAAAGGPQLAPSAKGGLFQSCLTTESGSSQLTYSNPIYRLFLSTPGGKTEPADPQKQRCHARKDEAGNFHIVTKYDVLQALGKINPEAFRPRNRLRRHFE